MPLTLVKMWCSGTRRVLGKSIRLVKTLFLTRQIGEWLCIHLVWPQEASDNSFFNVERLFEVIQVYCIDQSLITNELIEKKLFFYSPLVCGRLGDAVTTHKFFSNSSPSSSARLSSSEDDSDSSESNRSCSTPPVYSQSEASDSLGWCQDFLASARLFFLLWPLDSCGCY